MAKFRFNFRSEVLGYYTDVTVVIPTDSFRCRGPYFEKPANPLQKQEQKEFYTPGMKFQTVYLIHGGGDDDTLTYRYSNVEEAAERNRVMLVTPDIANSFGINTRYGVKYMDFVTEELPQVIEALFPASPLRDDRFIMGYAMGGNAALGMAVNHPELYRACVDISGGIGMTFCPETLKEELEGDHFKTYFPLYLSAFGPASEIEGSEYDLRATTLRRRAEGYEMPEFTLICGSEEFILKRVRADAAAMKELGIPVNYIEPEGYGHDFRLWDEYLSRALDDLLPLARGSVTGKESE